MIVIESERRNRQKLKMSDGKAANWPCQVPSKQMRHD